MKDRTNRGKLVVRRACLKDVDELVWLVNQAFAEYRRGKNNPNLEENVEDIIRDIEKNEVLLLERDNNILATLRLEYRGSNIYLLKRFAVSPLFQGQGFGKYLYREAEKRIISEEGELIYLFSSVEEENLVKYYTGLGFECIKVDQSMAYKRGLWVKLLPAEN